MDVERHRAIQLNDGKKGHHLMSIFNHFIPIYPAHPRLTYSRITPSRIFNTLADLVKPFIELPKLARRRWCGYLSLRFSSRSSSRSRVQRAKTRCALKDAVQVPLLHFARHGVHACLLGTPNPHHALEQVPHRRAEDDVPVARGERDEQGARDHSAR